MDVVYRMKEWCKKAAYILECVSPSFLNISLSMSHTVHFCLKGNRKMHLFMLVLLLSLCRMCTHIHEEMGRETENLNRSSLSPMLKANIGSHTTRDDTDNKRVTPKVYTRLCIGLYPVWMSSSSSYFLEAPLPDDARTSLTHGLCGSSDYQSTRSYTSWLRVSML